MPKINETELLEQRIDVLNRLVKEEGRLIKEQFGQLKDSLKPGKLINEALKEVTTSSDLKNNFINYAITIGAGALSRKLLVGSGINPIRNILGAIAQFGVSNLVSGKSDNIRSAGAGLLGKILNFARGKNKKGDQREAYEYNTY